MKHLMLDLYHIEAARLADRNLLMQVLTEYPAVIGMTAADKPVLCDIQTSTPTDDGMSGFTIIFSSHCSLLIYSDIYRFLSRVQCTYRTSFTFVIASLSSVILSRLRSKQRVIQKKWWKVEVNFMKVQRIQVSEQNTISWIVIGDDYLPIEPITAYLLYLEHIESSSHTIRAYAHHLKIYWEYLQEMHLNWTSVGLSELANFISWLRTPQPGIASLQEQMAKRSESTVNTIMAAVTSMYDYHERTGVVQELPLTRLQMHHHRRYKSFLHHITKSQPMKTRLLKLKTVQRDPQTLTHGQVQQLIGACEHLRDQFFVRLLYETGMRVGQALGLRHADIHSWDNDVQIVPRSNNANGARAKAREAYTIHVPADLMALYTDYLVQEFGETESDYVFVNLWDGQIGAPMKYPTIADLFTRLGKKAGIVDLHPHMLRHTHGTELSRAGWDVALIRKRLGHAQIQTTMRYIHLDDDDMKQAFQTYQKGRK